jgi:hypothetical protein
MLILDFFVIPEDISILIPDSFVILWRGAMFWSRIDSKRWPIIYCMAHCMYPSTKLKGLSMRIVSLVELQNCSDRSVPANALLVLIDQSWQAYIESSAFKICYDNPCVVRWKWEVFLQLLCAFNTGTKFSLCVAVHRGQ